MAMVSDFHHPYEPYDIQLELMRCVYTLLDSGKKLAVLESPTGTGKTLSLICSAVTWLRDNKAEFVAGAAGTRGAVTGRASDSGCDSDSDDPAWVTDAHAASVLESKLHGIGDYESVLAKLKKNSSAHALTFATAQRHSHARRQRKIAHLDVSTDDDSVFLPQDYVSDSEDTSVSAPDRIDQIRNEVSALLAGLDQESRASQVDQLQLFNPVKIFFASRTHSQLNQFASQLSLPHFASSFEKYNIPMERVKYLPLASRKQLCINPSVTKLNSVDAINDACLDLLKNNKSKDANRDANKCGCPFYKSASSNVNSGLLRSFQDQTFVDIHDIEDIADIGSSLNVCPYYASRSAILAAEIITLPYQYLLSQTTRESLSIDLTDSIVIIDEAHNLLDTINSIHSSEISLNDLKKCYGGLQIYFGKFRTKLSANNRVSLIKLMKLVDSLIRFIVKNFKKPGERIDSNFLSSDSNADTLNVHKINSFIKKSKIAFKVDSYNQSILQEQSVSSSSQPIIFKVSSFISCLSNPANEGQFFFEKGHTIKYMLLEPSKPFESILEKARCVILAGGTMQPISEILDNLSSNIPREKIEVFSCNHVIPDKNLETFIVKDSRFEFTFEKRDNPKLIEDLFDFYYTLSQSVPRNGGIVGFFPSYQYLEFVMKSWKKSAHFCKLNSNRAIFYESKSDSDPFHDYSTHVAQGKSAILFAVVGGKLSEGINFQDNLCRAVVMTGLPFPNVFSGELLIKKNHIENKILNNGGSKQVANKAVKDFYENICMKAVNQSIGRAIRHANDYALIYLLDKRYGNANINSKLSHWVKSRIKPQSSINDIMNSTKKFFFQH